MPSKKCPECGKIVTSNIIPSYCAWCGCYLAGQPIITEPLSLYHEQSDNSNSAVLHQQNPENSTNINTNKNQQMKLF